MFGVKSSPNAGCGHRERSLARHKPIFSEAR
jgi:hypothetical protein